jgi:propionyl-CoA carboxylase alpha chain
MFKKILVANRGEIACRVFKTARKMGIQTVAVYSDADKNALHTEHADEAVRIGPAPSSESYLVIDKIVEACRQTGAEAVHPGYGFLSENKAFSEALSDSGIVFIGPNARAIEAMGDKIESKKIAAEAGVNTIPGFAGVIADAAQAVEIANDIGYPVMLKASAGGGGKGMRVAYDDDACADGFERASNEARSSFGDDRVFVEKFIEQPRHIEIQIIADGRGKVLYLGERECSIQRRHQKVVEEAPSVFIDSDTRAAMGEQAVSLAKAVDYQSAGTVEFIVDADKHFYFLEMNTRLQVEHPVTEMVTGLDLVELMIRIAAGEPLEMEQRDVTLNGWALETRVYAEDPVRGFLPSTGRLIRYQPPPQSVRTRVDTGVYEGGEVSMYYDPMVAKLITHGTTRKDAIEYMRQALNQYYIRGISHNVSFLNALIAHPRFVRGDLSTNFIDEEYPEGYSDPVLDDTNRAMFVVSAGTVHHVFWLRANRISGRTPRAGSERHTLERVVVIGGEDHPIKIIPVAHGYDVIYRARTYRVTTDWSIGRPLFKALINGEEVCMQFEAEGVRYKMIYDGVVISALVLTRQGAELNRHMLDKPPPDLSKFLLSPMPGLLIQLKASVGDLIKEGEELAVVEAMKMENVLRAVQDVRVKKILTGEGESLVVDQPILEFE